LVVLFAIEKASPLSPPENLYAFEPDAGRVAFLDQRMRLRLADSLRYIWTEANGQLDLSHDRFEEFLIQLERHPVPPLAFSLYCETVFAIEEDDLDQASQLLGELTGLPPSPGLTIIDMADPRHNAAARRYASFVDAGSEINFEIFPPSSKAAAGCREQIQGAFDLMDAGDPSLAAEIKALLREIVLAAGADDPKALTFDGASASMLWGAIIINANRQDGTLGMVQMLAHESAHNLVFGLCAEEPLVENSPEELYPSPLRVDPRPMIGIYHATFVTARMHRVVKHLLDGSVLSVPLQEKARKELADNRRLFDQGIKVVRQHGKLTPLGEAIMQGAENYMASV
jgi:hypothetical protein